MVVDKAGISLQIGMLHEQRVKKAENHGVLVENGIGSAPGSLLLYALGITRGDPLEHRLLSSSHLTLLQDRITYIEQQGLGKEI